MSVPPHVPAARVHEYDFLRDPRLGSDLRGVLASLRNRPGLFYTPCNGGHWVATRGEIIAAILKNPEVFSNFPYLIPRSAGSPQPTPLTEMDAPAHSEYRRIVQQQMTPAVFNRMEPRFRASTRALIESVQMRGGCEFVADVGQRLPVNFFLDWMDLPQARAGEFTGWVQQLLRGADPQTRREGKLKAMAYLRTIVEARIDAPGDDLISGLAQAPFRGRRMDVDELMPVVAGVFNAGLDTVTSNMSFMIRFLAEHDDHRRQLVDEPALIPNAIEELMRWFTTANLARSCTRDIEIDGVTIRAGEQVLIPFVLYGLDERINAEAMTVDFRRKAPQHLAFGAGPHFCAGAYLARLELRVLLEEWLQQIREFRVAPGAGIETLGGVIFGIRALPLVWTV